MAKGLVCAGPSDYFSGGEQAEDDRAEMTETIADDRPTGRAMRRGAMRRCPNCGEGAMFQGYLKVRDHCPNCDEALYHQRADDGPAYLTILLVSHLGAPLLLWVFLTFNPSPISMLIGFSLGAIVLCLAFLPLIKGAFVGAQWARRMHGFGGDRHGDGDGDRIAAP